MNLTDLDRKYLWHPYTQHGLEESPLPLKSGEGAYLTLQDGRKVLDAISSWWVNLHGHGHPKISQAIFKQSQILEHAIFAGFTHEPAVTLAQYLIETVQSKGTKLSKVFYSDNGSTAVEVALKMAFQWQLQKQGRTRPRFLALKNAYHGDTFGAMAVGEPKGFHEIFRTLLPQVDFIDPDNIETLKTYLSSNKGEYSAIIVEPMVQGAGGMIFHQASFLNEIQNLCRENQILFICDEVFTGFYRTGKTFAFEHANLQPDLLCLSKGITGGFMPLAVTLATEDVFSAFTGPEISKAFLHGHSYTANPLACAAAVASWEILHDSQTLKNISAITTETRACIQKLAQNKYVKNARVLGTIGAIDMDIRGSYMSGSSKWFKERALGKKILLRPLGQVLYAVPPFCVTVDEVRTIYKVMEELVVEYKETQ